MGSSTGLWLALTLPFATHPQGGEEPLNAFRKLPEAKQVAILNKIAEAVREQETGLGAFVEKMLARDEAPQAPPPLWTGPVWYDPKIYAPGLPIVRKRLPESDTKLQEAMRKYGEGKWVDALQGRYRYLPGQNKIVRLHAKESPSLALAQMLDGFPPETALAREIVFQVLDDADTLDADADYFSHTYTDRDGNAYPGITIYDVWNSGFEIEMPDVDAIPFARHILKDNSFRSPIPAGPERTRLYHEIGEHFREFRRYLVLREAVASWFFAWDPAVSPLVEPMRDRIQLLIAWGAADPFMLRQFLKSHPGREDVIREADALMTELGSQAWTMLEKRKTQLQADRETIRETARSTLQRLLEEKP